MGYELFGGGEESFNMKRDKSCFYFLSGMLFLFPVLFIFQGLDFTDMGYVLLGYFLMLCSMGMVSVAYRGVPLKIAPALDSLGFVLVPMLSWLFFGERITRTKGLGFLLIVFGILIFVS